MRAVAEISISMNVTGMSKMGRSSGMRLIQGRRQVDTRNPEVQGLAGWLLRLLRSSHPLREAEGKQMRLLETMRLGGRSQLMLVSCGAERFLVGGGLESVETIVPIKAESLSGAVVNLDERCK